MAADERQTDVSATPPFMLKCTSQVLLAYVAAGKAVLAATLYHVQLPLPPVEVLSPAEAAASCTNAVVAIVVLLVPAACVVVVGEPAKAMLDTRFPP